MFLKNFRVKSNTAIRGSDRRKLKSDVLQAFPYFTQESISDVIPNKEDMSVMKIMTHCGRNVTAYTLNGSPIFFQVETKLYPTVYLLWKYPDMLPTFTTWPNVFGNIHGGADLMLPGVILPENSLDNLKKFQKEDVCSVTLLGNKAPVAVGHTAVSSTEAVAQGMRGKGVIILHSYQDQLWSQGSKSSIPIIETTYFTDGEDIRETCVDREACDARSDVVQKTIDIEHSVGDKAEQCGALSVEPGDQTDITLEEEQNLTSKGVKKEEVKNQTSCQETDTTEESLRVDICQDPIERMDKLLENAFFCALLNMKSNDLPVLTSTFYKNYLLPCCPQGQSLDIKKSSFKKLTKFLQMMEKRRFITTKEESKGVHSIDCINWDNNDLRSFKRENISLLQENIQIDKELDVETTFQPPEIEEVLAVSGTTQSLFKECGYSKGAVLSAKEVRQVVTDYVKCQELVSAENKRTVLLNPVLFSVVRVKEEGNIDCLTWDELFKRVINRMNPCQRVTFFDQAPVIRKGKLEPIDIKVVQRMGNKKVTLVHNLEYYGIDPGEFAHKLQLKAASSTSVSPLPGKSTTAQQVLIQGNQTQHVGSTLRDEYKIATKYVSGLEKPKQSRPKKK